MKFKNFTIILLSIFMLESCGEKAPSAPQLESVVQNWTGSEYAIKAPIEKGDIRLIVSENISGAAKLVIPASVTATENPNITIELSSGVAFTGSLTIDNNDYAGTVTLKQSDNSQIAVGTQTVSSDKILQVNLPKGSFTIASGKVNGKAVITTRPGTFILGGVISGDLIIDKGSVKIMVGGELVSITINNDEPIIVNGTVTGTITVADGCTSTVTIGAGATVGSIVAPLSNVSLEPSTDKTTTVGTITGKNVTVSSGTTTKDIVISDGGSIKVDQGGSVDGNIDASNAESSDISEGTVSGKVTSSPTADGSITDWEDQGK